MMNYTISKDFGTGKMNAEIKERLTQIIIDALSNEFGGDNVAMVRTGTSTGVNEIGVKVGEVSENGFVYEVCATVNPTVKSYKEKVTKRYTVEAFDFESAKQRYFDYVTEVESKRIENAKRKADKIARDKAARIEKAKANLAEMETE